MIVLDKRLSLIAELVSPGSAVCDIGTDHAFLPIHLVQSGRASRVIACDLREGPLSVAKNNVNHEGAAGKIELRLCSGLEGVSPNEAEVIIIAGMGGETIAEIINGATWLKNKNYTLLLQPMTSSEQLLDYLNQNGFSVLFEKAVYAVGRLYVIIKALYTGSIPSKDPLFPIIGGLLDHPDKAALDFLERKLKSLIKCAANLKSVPRKSEEYQTVLHHAKLLEERLLPYLNSN